VQVVVLVVVVWWVCWLFLFGFVVVLVTGICLFLVTQIKISLFRVGSVVIVMVLSLLVLVVGAAVIVVVVVVVLLGVVHLQTMTFLSVVEVVVVSVEKGTRLFLFVPPFLFFLLFSLLFFLSYPPCFLA
jgi:hypothetical protein